MGSLLSKMKLLLLFVCMVAACSAAPQKFRMGFDPENRIVGGHNAEPGQFPHIVSIRRKLAGSTSHVCGGSVINEFWILTAGHCVTEMPAGTKYAIWAGAHDFSKEESTRQVLDVIKSIVHPDYQGKVNPHDIALMQLSGPLTFNEFVKPMALPASAVEPKGTATLAGWGATTPIPIVMPKILQTIDKPIISYAECEKALGQSPLAPTNVCTGPLTGGISACSGDSGGPLTQVQGGKVVQVGIVSWGMIPCGSKGAPSVYTGVSHYIDFINQYAF